MLLNDLSKHLSDKFTLENPCYELDENVVCYTFNFISDVSFHNHDHCEQLNINTDGTQLDNGEKENQNFRYAVFAPVKNRLFSEAIIMLHGLNERKWEKYLPWAYQLVLQTQKPVILFPIAYHINRSPLTWICPRLMNKFSIFRKASAPAAENSTFANVALSLRLDRRPQLFALSGIQTYFDIIKLTTDIRAGHIEIFDRQCHIDFFAYSIGALLTETLLISNPLQLFSDSKAFFFCGGSTFDKINGSSRAIMDHQAFDHLHNYVLHHTEIQEKEIKIPKNYAYLLKDGWKAFLAMSGMKKFINDRDEAFQRLINRIKAIGLKGDFVVPGTAIKETFGKVFNNACFDVEVMDFPFKYSHETPFPMNIPKINDSVSHSFQTVFRQASLFLS